MSASTIEQNLDAACAPGVMCPQVNGSITLRAG
jgi:hypothetical protein